MAGPRDDGTVPEDKANHPNRRVYKSRFAYISDYVKMANALKEGSNTSCTSCGQQGTMTKLQDYGGKQYCSRCAQTKYEEGQ